MRIQESSGQISLTLIESEEMIATEEASAEPIAVDCERFPRPRVASIMIDLLKVINISFN